MRKLALLMLLAASAASTAHAQVSCQAAEVYFNAASNSLYYHCPNSTGWVRVPLSGGGGGGGGGATTFDMIQSGTNTSANMVVGSGATMTATGTGVIAATTIPFAGVQSGSSTATLNIDTGGALAATGSGTITATAVPWTGIFSFPAACPSGQFVTAIGLTSTCATPSGTLTSNNVWTGTNSYTNSVTFTGNITGVMPACTNSAFTATPNYSMTFDNCQIMTLTSNVTSITISGTPTARTALYLKFPQDGAGSHTVTWPANFIFPTGWQLKLGANNENDMAWQFDGANWWPISDWGTGSGGGGGGTPGGAFGDPQCNVAGAFGTCGAAPASTSNVALKPNMPGSPTVGALQFVAVTGNDSNDGLSWGSAKATINAAICSLPNGNCSTTPRLAGTGTVYYQDGVFADANHSYGIWIAGSGDSQYISGLPTGWMKAYPYESLSVVCATHSTESSNDHLPKCNVNGGTNGGQNPPGSVPNSLNKPLLQISGTVNPMYFEGLVSQYSPVAWIGVDSSGGIFGAAGYSHGQAVSITLDNVSCYMPQPSVVGMGPCFLQGANYWNHIWNSSMGGNNQEALGGITFSRTSGVTTVTVPASQPPITITKCPYVTGDVITVYNIIQGDDSFKGTYNVASGCGSGLTFTYNQSSYPDSTNASPGAFATVASDRAWGAIFYGTQVEMRDLHESGGGGMKFYGTTSSNLQLNNVYMEGTFYSMPMFYASTFGGSSGIAEVAGLFMADTGGYLPGVVNEGINLTTRLVQNSGVYTNSPGTYFGENLATLGNSVGRTRNYLANGAMGNYKNHWEAAMDTARRTGGPTGVRFQNFAQANGMNGTFGCPLGNLVITASKTDPFGGSAAYQAVSSSGTANICYWQPTLTYNVGDTFVAGVWIRSVDGSPLPTTVLEILLAGSGNQCQGGQNNVTSGPVFFGDGNWEWITASCTIAANPTQPSLVSFYTPSIGSTHPLQVYAPYVGIITANTLSASELAEFVNNIPGGMSTSSSAGDVAFYPNQKFCLPSSSGTNPYCGYMIHANTANRTYTFPDSSGTLCLVGSCGGGSGTWNGIGNPVGVGNLNLTMYNGSVNYTSAWNFTGAGTLTGLWNWNNITAATSGTSQSSPQTQWCGNAWHAAASVTDCLGISVTPGNGTDAAITWNFAHVGSSTGYVTASFAGGVASGSNGGQGGMILLPEGTIPTTPNPLGAAGQDNCYADSTAHHRLCKDNNGTLMSDTRSPTSSTTNDFASFADTSGAVLQDSGILGTNLVTQTSNASANQICAYTGTNKVCVPTTTLPTAAVPAFTGSISNSAGSLTTTLASQYLKLYCSPGLGDGLNAIPAGTYLQFSCVNKSGVTWTITGISCWTDNAGTSTLNAANNAATGLLTGAVTCNNTKSGGGATGTQSATTTIANNDAISFTFVADGTTKQTTWTVSFTQ